MSDWTDELTPEEREGWDSFVDHFRREAVEMISDSAIFLSIVPTQDKIDVKFCTELGAAIMLGKPIVSVKMPGAEIPPLLRGLSRAVIEADIDTEEGREALAVALEEVFGDG